MTEPRFAVCTVGDDRFSVKDRTTRQPLGYYRTQAEAETATDAFNRLYQEEERRFGVRQRGGQALRSSWPPRRRGEPIGKTWYGPFRDNPTPPRQGLLRHRASSASNSPRPSAASSTP